MSFETAFAQKQSDLESITVSFTELRKLLHSYLQPAMHGTKTSGYQRLDVRQKTREVDQRDCLHIFEEFQALPLVIQTNLQQVYTLNQQAFLLCRMKEGWQDEFQPEV